MGKDRLLIVGNSCEGTGQVGKDCGEGEMQ